MLTRVTAVIVCRILFLNGNSHIMLLNILVTFLTDDYLIKFGLSRESTATMNTSILLRHSCRNKLRKSSVDTQSHAEPYFHESAIELAPTP